VHAEVHGRRAYRRAARAVMMLDEPLDAFVARRPARDIPYIGPASERVILEWLEHGRSPRVERAVDASPRRDELEAARALRTNFLSRAAALRILADPSIDAVGRADVRGDLQMHTAWSDGSESVAEMAEAARARDYQWIGVSDHSYGLAIAGGIGMEDARRQHREIDDLNREWRGTFRVLKGIEANIPIAGGVDMRDDELAEFEIVLAAPHSRLRKADDQTERMLGAVRHPGVHVLAHPRGRMLSRRGVIARWDEVFDEARRREVAIELDGDPYRQDLDHGLARRALAAGCLFALDSDAHSGAELAYTDFALAHARLAGIPAERVVNAWPVEAVLDWAARSRRG
jgi:histidinol phosphatase-like PHP family hydrolase